MNTLILTTASFETAVYYIETYFDDVAPRITYNCPQISFQDRVNCRFLHFGPKGPLLYLHIYDWTYTCEQHQGLLCDEIFWLSEEQVSLHEKSLKDGQSPDEEHQAWFCHKRSRENEYKCFDHRRKLSYSLSTYFLRIITARRSLMSCGLMQCVMSSAA